MITYFKMGNYLTAAEAQADAVSRLDAFGDTAKIVAKNAVTELIGLQSGTITCQQVSVIASAVANIIRGETYGETI